MNQHLQNYFHSFQLKKTYWSTFLIDLVFFGFFTLLFSFFGRYLQQKSVELMQGRTPEELQQLLAASPEQAFSFLTGLKWFLFTLLGGGLLLVIFFFLFYSLAQALIWNLLSKKKLTQNNHWRWNGLNLALLIPLLIYGILFFLVKLTFGFLFKSLVTIHPTFYFQHTQILDSLLTALNGLVTLALGIFLLLFIFLIYYSFTSKYKVWLSLGEGFHLLKIQGKKIWPLFFLLVATAIIVTLILWPIRALLLSQPWANTMIDLIVSLLFLAWMRIYLLQTLEHGTEPTDSS